jgi:hypothetical protein
MGGAPHGHQNCVLEWQLAEEVCINDLVIIDSDLDNIKSFSKEMAAAFKISDLGLLCYYLDIEMKQSASGISLSQGVYATKLLERCGIWWDAIPIIRPWKHA